MAEVQDDEQWLYGDDDGSNGAKEAATTEQQTENSTEDSVVTAEVGKSDADKENVAEENGEEKEMEEGEKDKDGESSDEDDVTITIGELKKAAEVMTPAQQQSRFQPKAAPTTGLKDDDFTGPGKVNGVPVQELTNDDAERPWRKPGADLSDYFNYGFNEDSWFKYCDRQKRMRVSESGSGLYTLGVNLAKPFGNSGPQQNDNSKYGEMSNILISGGRPNRALPTQPPKRPDPKSNSNAIQVMTADRREYSNKLMSQPPPPQFMGGNGPPPPNMMSGGYDEMEFGGFPGPDNGYYPPAMPPSNFYTTPPPSATSFPPNNWSNPPPPVSSGPPPTAAPTRGWGGDLPPTPAMLPRSDTPGPAHRDRDRDSDDDRRRPSRRHRRVSRSPSRSRHRSRSRSRSRSPSHKHKRKKSKRDRDD